MSGAVRCGQDHRPQARRRQNEDAAHVEDPTINDRSVGGHLSSGDLSAGGDDVWQTVRLAAEIVEEVERRR